jgi:lysosomal Pro-X carboxypeptidase
VDVRFCQNITESVQTVLIEGGAHHLDLMFSHPDDPDSVKWARDVELTHIRRWIAQADAYNGF